jgi:predicted nucleotidyltransferase
MENVQNNLEKSILATIAYFDIFDYPLTVVEIWKWIYGAEVEDNSPNIGKIWENLENNQLIKSLVDCRRGFYFLKNRDDLVGLREERYVLAVKKIKKARRVARFLKFIPGIKMIALCNSLAWTNAREESDIDFFIVTDKNKIWTVRFWTAGFLQIFGLRPNRKSNKDKICLSFFVDEDSLNLEPLAISVDKPDIYLIYWIAQLQPLFDRGGIYQDFWQANDWVKNFIPNVFPGKGKMKNNKIFSPGTIGFTEKFFRWIQLKMFPRNLREMANRDSRVVITDKILKFHSNDRREKYRKMWEEKINQITKQL